MQNSISYWQHMLLQEIEETSYKKSGLENPNLADLDKDKDISSWEKKRGSAIEKNLEEDNFFGLKVGDTVKFKDSSDRNVATVKYNVKNPNTEFKITALHHGHPEVPDPNTHADLKDKAGNEIKKVYTGYLEKVSIQEGEDQEANYEEYDDDDFAEFSYLADTLENAKIISYYIESKFEKLGISTDIDNVSGPGPFKIIIFDVEEKAVPRIIKIINKAVSDKTITDFSDEEIKNIISLNNPKSKLKNESEDHEVSMANNSIETIIKHAMDLKAKLGDDEKDIPAWIQDHITNAANFISQAAENYHEYGDHEAEEETEDSLTSIMEKIIKNGHK